MIGLYRRLREAGVLSLNDRNANFIMRHNPRRLYPLVDNKILCKHKLIEHGIAVPQLLGEIRGQYEAGHLGKRLAQLDQFVIKPASGSGGDGIVVITGRQRSSWVTAGGRLISLSEIQYHVAGILAGMYSLGGQTDSAMLESLIHPDPVLKPVAPEGVPDIRIIVYRGVPVMAMMRLPTRRSGGKANLHQGAIGAGVDVATGITLKAVMNSSVVDQHPDTAASVEAFQLPDWEGLLLTATRCYDAIPLGYLGVDLVLDRDHGPLVLEMNARPGLAIQIANGSGLRSRLSIIDGLHEPEKLAAPQRVELAIDLAKAGWRQPAA
ncbi:MAG: alpha-L-glutamate ligase-like protein [Wenzhouxiangella sp.]